MPDRALPWPALAALAVGAVVAGTLAVVQPLLGLALAVVALVVTLLARTRLSRLGRFGIAAAAVAAILGPNLALPQAPQVFGFRVLIVLIGLGLVAYVLIDGRLGHPARAAASGRAADRADRVVAPLGDLGGGPRRRPALDAVSSR